MVIKDLNAIFYHIPKNGGSSVANVWIGNKKLANHEESWPRWIHNNNKICGLVFPNEKLHARIADYGKMWDSHYKFTIIRDPFDACESYYYWLLKWRGKAPPFSQLLRDFRIGDMAAMCNEVAERAGDFDRILNFSCLREEWKLVQSDLNIDLPLGHYNKSDRPSSFKWSSGDRARVESLFCQFFEKFDKLF